MNRLLKSPLWCALLSLTLAQMALATDPIYQNFSPSSYVVSYPPAANPPPAIDARAFDNESQFEVNFGSFNSSPELYETANTLFYTNNGTMIANSPLLTNGFLFTFGSVGCGFNFDQLQTTNQNKPNQMADTFYNPGFIYCDSTLTGNNVFDFTGINFFIQTSIGELFVSATNIINPGTVEVGANGLIQFTGQNADFTRATLTMEGQSTGQNISSLGFFGTDTNQDWDPSIDLGVNYAYSSFSGYYAVGRGLQINQLLLTNSTPYFNIQQTGPSNQVVRAVFLMDTSPNVVTNVFLLPLTTNNLGSGTADVEWIGSYLDAATGQTISNYLYLNDDYLLGASTNVALVGGNGAVNSGYPDNFTITSSSSELLPGQTPVTPGFPLNFTFPAGAITNPYAYMTAQLIATTTSTNASYTNPSGAITNLSARLQINASKELNLTLAQISGHNYMSLTATNQYDGSAGAQINSPYSDINLGVTNGYMTISNLLAAGIPAWSGTLQAWSTRWTNVDATGISSDYRVLLVRSQLSPTSPPQVQTLKLHATNSLVISDALNVYSSFYIDAQSLTLTTNLPGNGATSLDGELNWENSANIGTGQLPNLLWLTNNGAIRSQGFIQLGSATTSYGAVINNGLFSDQGSTIFANNFLSSGAISNGIGNFLLSSQTATITNSSLTANGNVSITTASLVTSNLQLRAGKSLTLQVTNLLTDTGPTNGSYWTVGSAISPNGGVGFSLPIKPALGDLLGTTITNVAWTNFLINDTWSGLDRGYSNSGYSNNAAIGQLVLDPLSKTTTIHFSGTGVSNAIYVDCLVLLDQATNLASGNIPEFTFNTNLVIYYAQALQNGVSVAEKLNFANTNHFRWVPTYAGYFSSTNLVYPAGVTNTVNAALAQSSDIDSDGDGTVNSQDSTPFLVPAQLNFSLTLTNRPPPSVRLQWFTIPGATNYVYYKTNLLSPGWFLLTNFISPQPYPSPASPVSVFDVRTNVPHFYQVKVLPWLTQP